MFVRWTLCIFFFFWCWGGVGWGGVLILTHISYFSALACHRPWKILYGRKLMLILHRQYPRGQGTKIYCNYWRLPEIFRAKHQTGLSRILNLNYAIGGHLVITISRSLLHSKFYDITTKNVASTLCMQHPFNKSGFMEDNFEKWPMRAWASCQIAVTPCVVKHVGIANPQFPLNSVAGNCSPHSRRMPNPPFFRIY